MMKFLIFAVILICLLEGVPLIKKGRWKELMTIGFLLLIAIFLQISNNLGIVAPINFIEKLLEPIGKAILKEF